MIKDIYLFNTKRLAENLAKNEISDAVAVKNIIILTIIFGAVYEFPIYFKPNEIGEDSWRYFYTFFNWICTGVIHVIGINICYSTSKSHKVSNFFKSFFSLSLPVTINVSIIYTILFILSFYALEKLFGAKIVPYYSYLSVLFLTSYQALIYFEINRHLKIKNIIKS